MGLRLGVLVSGGGSNLQAIIDNIEAGRLSAEVVVVISNEPGAYGLTRAENHGIPGVTVDHRDFSGRGDFEEKIVAVLREYDVELVVLAGFMRLVTQTMLDAFPNRVVNIHPALLPSFPGTHVWQDEIDYGVKLAGCTVHFVDEKTDHGPIIVQAAVPVLNDDDADTLSARILKQEHRIFSKAIQLFAEGRLTVVDRKVLIDGRGQGDEDAVLISPPLDV